MFKNDFQKKELSGIQKKDSKKKKKFRFRWWYIPILVLILAAIAAGIVYFYVNGKIQHGPSFTNNWAAAISAAGTTSTDDSGLSALDSGDFSQVTTKNYPIIKVKQKDPNIQNILIMGIDGGDPGDVGVNRADSIIVASLNSRDNTLKLTSLMRDTKTYYPNMDSWHKLNAAYSYGGPGLQIDIINYAFKLDIQKYIQIDFSQYQNIIEAAGGVDMQLSATEASYVGIGSKAGMYHLEGEYALNYVRARKIDSDYERSQRQRNVMTALIAQFKDVSISKKIAVANTCLNYIETNIPTTELLGTLMSFESSLKGNIDQIEIPSEEDGMHTTETSPIWYWNLDWDQENARLSQFIYGK